MTQIARRTDSSFLLPRPIARMGENPGRAFIDFFTAQIRNANTRAGYGRNVARFLDWIEDADVALPEVEPFHVAAYIEELGGAGIPGCCRRTDP